MNSSPAVESAATVESASARKVRILLVDDRPELFVQLTSLLEDEYEVQTVATAEEALKRALQDPPDLIGTDVVMPGMSGIELLRTLRTVARTQAIPVILISGQAPEETRLEALEMGADAYLYKPFKLSELRAQIRSTLQGARVRAAAIAAATKAEAEAVHLRERAMILESISDGFYALDTSWRFTYLNQRAADYFGHPRQELLGQEIWKVIPRAQETLFEERLREAHDKRGAIAFEFHAPHSQRWLDVRAYPTPEGLAISFQDITARKQADTDLEQALAGERAARQEAERLGHLKDEFLATLSHELRTPLNSMLGWASLLRGPKVGADDMARGLETIERNARSQATMISDLLDMSRIISGTLRLEVRTVNLHAVLASALDAIAPAALAKGVRIQHTLDARIGQIRGDADRLQQVFWNLLSNAVKFTPARGRVHIVLEQVNSHLEVSFEDTGSGIDREFLPYVFDRFRQADSSITRRAGGLGLGLSIVRSLVELHGGSVRAKSPGLGQGSTFIVALPMPALRDDVPDSHSKLTVGPCRIATEVPKLTGVRVLVVDDEPDARTLLSRILEEREAVVTTVGGAAEALGLLRETPFDVLVSDIGMPDIDGYEFIRTLRGSSAAYGAGVPAIALTAFAGAQDRQLALLAGFQQHIAKPVEPLELVAAVASLVALIKAGASK